MAFLWTAKSTANTIRAMSNTMIVRMPKTLSKTLEMDN